MLIMAFAIPEIHRSYAVRLANTQDQPNFLLSEYDEQLYRSIFDLQQAGKMAQADKAIAQLKDKRLMGYVLNQRYLHPTAYTSSYEELKHWLILYKDLPGAGRIHELAKKKSKQVLDVGFLRSPKERRKIIALSEPTMIEATPYHKSRKYGGYDKDLDHKIARYLRKGQRTQAVNTVETAANNGKYHAEEIDYLKSKIAASYLYSGDVEKASKMAAQAFIRSTDKVPLAGWVYGLTLGIIKIMTPPPKDSKAQRSRTTDQVGCNLQLLIGRRALMGV